jgi:hypothetical protein
MVDHVGCEHSEANRPFAMARASPGDRWPEGSTKGMREYRVDRGSSYDAGQGAGARDPLRQRW